MTICEAAAFTGFMATALVSAGNGLWYLFSGRIKPYHCRAMESKWEDLPKGVRVMSLCFMKSAAAGMLTGGIALAALLIFPYRRGELWAKIAVCLTALPQSGILAAQTYRVWKETKGNPPLAVPAASAVLAAVCAVLTFAG